MYFETEFAVKGKVGLTFMLDEILFKKLIFLYLGFNLYSLLIIQSLQSIPREMNIHFSYPSFLQA